MSDQNLINIEKLNPSEFEKEAMPFMMLPTKVIQQISNENPMAAIMWVYLQSLPPTWTPNKFHLMSHFKIGERTYQKYMAYLADSNLVSYTRGRNKNGTLGSVRLIVHNGSNFKPVLGSDHTAKICIVDFNHTAKTPHCGSTTPVAKCAHINNINIQSKEEDNKKDIPPKSPKGGRGGFGLFEMLNNNPHNIPEKILSDWMEVRKAKKQKMTETTWGHIHKNIDKLMAKGFEPIFLFTTAVGRSWAGIEVRFYDEYLNEAKKTPVIRPVDDKELREKLKQQAIEREQKEQEAKEREKKEAPGIMKNLKSTLAERMAQHEAAIRASGLSKDEYHAKIVNERRLPEDSV